MSDGVNCPECGRDFDSEHGMHIHQSKVHEEHDGETQKTEIRPERKELADTNIAAWNNLNNGNYEKSADLFDEVSQLAAEMRDKVERRAVHDAE